MQVIILKTKEIKTVSLGYAVNYLLPKGLVVLATKRRLALLESSEKKAQAVKSISKSEDRQQAERLDGKVIKLKVKAGKLGKIHGSITKKEIAKTLKILKTQVILAKPIKKVGEYEIELNFGETKAKIKLKVEAE